jgi:hypothetical protein
MKIYILVYLPTNYHQRERSSADLMGVILKANVICDVMMYQYFGGPCCLQFLRKVDFYLEDNRILQNVGDYVFDCTSRHHRGQ